MISKQKLKIKKGDLILVLAGKDRGKKGKVIEVFSALRKVVVEGVNVAKKHARPTRNFPGGIIDRALPMFISKVMLVCPHCHQPARVGSKTINKKHLRICGKCEEIVDKV